MMARDEEEEEEEEIITSFLFDKSLESMIRYIQLIR
jgi:hypothetical protein